ncbi:MULTISPECIES: tRNA (uracil-5-)-methyltransferase [unclassified Oceanobacter]|jgi:hypothetical protein|uniref:tRNA (uracil-5-)-methyltransferase n=1 Tax=unclassified Oceanobacter TaxID=2620260 RepID=UPI0026E34607|nr:MULTISPECIES: tRNA (uracil-5-)-methyltransferase [unclassified Oceanobacter]MDO6683203.1 tRNA (uracil-5-)-methyltransferase [Oceanobacter sp. 5_MG-2023]MDP2506198.1 tRNA (uracil-5-)-methyltransferase [Oceanobacter sp. 3_MG-2023]MDP2547261.1 tRNA (uracil-5-)-methyltransferase [Oceanobacter sp. 4_MG-2023]MDP2607385.1 tRNA (uracil-5-)-methyltransferase [Oceanobacter sp. 1_MG-2023]MDP2610653.1 tRNA (uracil-5-)-methyltransferase [Oceanobacter sp. 2_MG-2023]
MASETVVDFAAASEKHRHQRDHRDKEARVEAIRERFEQALPTRKTPVKDYLRKKRAKKKR